MDHFFKVKVFLRCQFRFR